MRQQVVVNCDGLCFLADRTATQLLHSMIGYWQRPVVRLTVGLSVCLSVRLSVTLCTVALRVGVRG